MKKMQLNALSIGGALSREQMRKLQVEGFYLAKVNVSPMPIARKAVAAASA